MTPTASCVCMRSMHNRLEPSPQLRPASAIGRRSWHAGQQYQSLHPSPDLISPGLYQIDPAIPNGPTSRDVWSKATVRLSTPMREKHPPSYCAADHRATEALCDDAVATPWDATGVVRCSLEMAHLATYRTSPLSEPGSRDCCQNWLAPEPVEKPPLLKDEEP